MNIGEAIGGGIGIILVFIVGIFLLALGIMWIILPWFLMNRLDKMLQTLWRIETVLRQPVVFKAPETVNTDCQQSEQP